MPGSNGYTPPSRFLTVGSGPHYAPGWVNLDIYSDPTWAHPPDVLASVFDMPFEDDYFTKVYIGHVLEHLAWDEMPDAMREVQRVMKPGGTLIVVGPCIKKAIQTRQPWEIIEAILAKPQWCGKGGGNHAWTATEEYTAQAVATIYWKHLDYMKVNTIVPPEWPNPTTAPWQCAIRAIK